MVQNRVHTFHDAVDVAFVARPVDSYFLGLILQLGGHVQGDHENRNVRCPSPDLPGGIETIHFGHLKIQDDHIRCRLLCFFDRFLTIAGFLADLPGPLLFQQRSQATAHQLAVVHQEDSNGTGFIPFVPDSHADNVRGRTRNVYTPHRVDMVAFPSFSSILLAISGYLSDSNSFG